MRGGGGGTYAGAKFACEWDKVIMGGGEWEWLDNVQVSSCWPRDLCSEKKLVLPCHLRSTHWTVWVWMGGGGIYT